MRNKTINRILIKEIIKEYLGVVLTIITLLVLLYISVFVARFVIFIFIFYFVISLKYIIQSFKNESLFLRVYKTNKSSKEDAKALVEALFASYSPSGRNKSKIKNDKISYISEPLYSRRKDITKSSEYPNYPRSYGILAVHNSALRRKKRLYNFSEKRAQKNMKKDKNRVIILKRLKWIYDQHEY